MLDPAHAEHSPMALPLPNGKLAMWLFLVTEIMFFTALIGTYLIIRQSIPQHEVIRWPSPKDVHLAEIWGAVNTFVLILSSLTVVLAHFAAGKGDFKRATLYIAVTTVLGCVFMGIKAYEYRSKFQHDILPGRIGELLPEMGLAREKQFHAVGMQYVNRVREQLEKQKDDVSDPEIKAEMEKLLTDMTQQEPQKAGEGKKAVPFRSPLTPAQVGGRVNDLLHKAEANRVHVHLTPAISYGNMWASFYFAMTGFHALHVLGGIVAFVIILIIGFMGRMGPQHVATLEYTGLYWHFVDIVWIFLFPLLYLV